MEHLEGRALLSQFWVTNLGDSGDGSLRQAIIGSNGVAGPNEIDFAAGLAGTITLTGGPLTITNNDVSIVGPGRDVLSVDGNGAGRVLEVDGVQVALSGLTITGGAAPDGSGGGILDSGGTVSIDSSAITNNTAYQGGGISVIGGTLLVTGSTISGNTAVMGGGIYSSSGDVTLSGVTVSNNVAQGIPGADGSGGAGGDAQGGGIYSGGGTFWLMNNTQIVGNQARGGDGGSGGGGQSGSFGSPGVPGGDGTGATSGGGAGGAGRGGGLCIIGGALALSDSSVSGNSATGGAGGGGGNGGRGGNGYRGHDPFHDPGTSGGNAGSGSSGGDGGSSMGGGIYATNGTINITNLTLQSNSAVAGGGGDGGRGGDGGTGGYSYVSYGGNAGNGAAGGAGGDSVGGGFYAASDSVAITSSILQGNDATGGSAGDGGDGGNAGGVYGSSGGAGWGQVGSAGDAGSGGIGQGGGLYSGTSTVTIDGSSFEANAASGGPGGAGGGGGFTWSGGSAGGKGGDGASGQGGGVYSGNGTIVITNSALLENAAKGGDGGDGGTCNGGHSFGQGGVGQDGQGGGLYSSGDTLVVQDSTLGFNAATGGKGGDGGSSLGPAGPGGSGGPASGGGLDSNQDVVTITNSTLGCNTATGGPGGASGSSVTGTARGGDASGAGADFSGDGTTSGEVSVVNATISANTATAGPAGAGTAASRGGTAAGGGIDGPVTISNSIVAGNSAIWRESDFFPAPDAWAGLTSLGHNLIGNPAGSSGWLDNDFLNVDPKLGPLQDNGGPTTTMALLPGSPAIDAGVPVDGVATDQRGALRGPAGLASGSAPDIGAYEASSSYLVTSTEDSLAVGTLRTAVAWANVSANANPADDPTNPVPNTIVFDAAGAFATAQTITLSPAFGPLILSNTSTAEVIEGPGPKLLTVARSSDPGTPDFRIFTVVAGADVTLDGLTITGGRADDGGGISNSGTLALGSCAITGNETTSNDPSGRGGGIYSEGTLTIGASLIDANSARQGGGVYSVGSLTIEDGTVFGNSGVGGGGGVYNEGGTLTVIASTISGNSAVSGGGVYSDGPAASIEDSIVAGNSASGGPGPDASGLFSTQGYNLVGKPDGSTGWGDNDRLGVDPLLAPLGDYGGPTMTMALLPGSPAIDAGTGNGAPATDQRGVSRPQGAGYDIGAFESRGFTLTPANPSTPQTAVIGTAFGQPLALTVTANDPSVPVDGGVVAFAVNPVAGAGAALSAATATIAGGQAQVSATAGDTPGSYTVTASAGGTSTATFDLTNLLPITISPSALGPATAGVAFSQALAASGALGGPFTFQVTAGALPSNFTLSSDGTLGGTSTLAATANFTVTATGQGGYSGSQAYSLTVNPGPTSQFLVAGFPSPVTAGVSGNFTVTAQDAWCNTTPGYSGTVRFTSSDGQAALPAGSTLTNGVGSFSATLKTAGTQSITATDGTCTASQVGITVNPAGACTLTVAGFPSPVTAGVQESFTVTAYDPFGNIATGYAGTVKFISSDGRAVLPAGSGLTDGTGSFPATLKTAGTQSITASDDTFTASQTGIMVTPNTAAALVITTQPSATATAGVAFAAQPVVALQDAYGNVETGDSSSTVTAASTGTAALQGIVKVTVAKGVATFAGLSYSKAETMALQFTTGAGGFSTTSNNIVVSPNVTAQFLVAGFPSPVTAGASCNFTVSAQDAYGNTTPAYSGKVKFSSTDPQADLPNKGTLTNGTGTFTATLKTAGNQSITATDKSSGLTGTQVGITVTAAAAKGLTLTAPSTAVVGKPFTITVTAFDPYGNVATGYGGTVTFTSTDKQAVLPRDYKFTTADDGVHAFTSGVTLESTGNQKVTVTDKADKSLSDTAKIKVSATAPVKLAGVGPGTGSSAAGDAEMGALPAAILDWAAIFPAPPLTPARKLVTSSPRPDPLRIFDGFLRA
jgi:hypothetical protein